MPTERRGRHIAARQSLLATLIKIELGLNFQIQEKLLNTLKENLSKCKQKNEKEAIPTLQCPGENAMVSKKVVVAHTEAVGRHVVAGNCLVKGFK